MMCCEEGKLGFYVILCYRLPLFCVVLVCFLRVHNFYFQSMSGHGWV